MIHEILPVGQLQCNCSVIGDEQSGEAMVVDPGDEINRILDVVKKHGLTVKSIVITHAHIDHIGGAQKLKTATGAPVYMHGKDEDLKSTLDMQAAWLGIRRPDEVATDAPLGDGDKLKVGGTELIALHTPGHTQGSTSLWIPSACRVLAGDTLFRDSIGRTDLPGGDSHQILRSIHEKLLTLPEDTLVIPGHGENTTIGREKQFNFFLRVM
jgi:hydroxyacylglutathione hydrolase